VQATDRSQLALTLLARHRHHAGAAEMFEHFLCKGTDLGGIEDTTMRVPAKDSDVSRRGVGRRTRGRD
jgi:hypothetical protein